MPSLIKPRSYYDPHEIQGEGILDWIKHPIEQSKQTFVVERYPGEQHARENLIGRPYNFLGPHTNLSRRISRHTGLPKESSLPINSIDNDARIHDQIYDQLASEYYKNPTPENRRRKLDEIHHADDVFIENVKRHRADDPVVANIAANLIRAKKLGERMGVLDTKKFSGFGEKKNIDENDPSYKLRLLAKKYNKNYDKEQKGGAFPAFLIPILAAGASKLVEKIYDTIKEKIENKNKKEGTGYKLPHHKTSEQKKKFLIELVKHL